MSLRLNDEQHMLRDAAAGFLAERAPIAMQRRLRDSGAAPLFDEALWREVTALGWPAAALPEEQGGLGAGWKALGAVFEAAGRHLSAMPMLSSIVLAGSLLSECTNAALREAWLQRLLNGTARLALALDEQARHNPQAIACLASPSPTRTGWVLSGDKRDVIDAIGADAFIIAAMAGGQLQLFIVERGAAGLALLPTPRIDSRNAAALALHEVHVGVDALLPLPNAQSTLDLALDRARVCLAAETLGLARRAFEMTLGYLKERVQFGVPIGSFQALQHRAARLYVGLELLESCVAGALEALDEHPADVPGLASLAKARAAELGETLLNEAVQMHGGIGVTDEFDLGLLLKRARVIAQTLGDALYHRDRYARLKGF